MKYLKYFETLKSFNFVCNNLTSLYGQDIPDNVNGYFDCEDNELTSLEYGPKTVTLYFDCSNNNLISLEFCPETVGNSFFCNHNKLTSLEFCPEKIGGNFNCCENELTSLEFHPEYVQGIFYCADNPWIKPIPYELIKKFNITFKNIYTDAQKYEFGTYEYQKEYLTNTPEKYKDLEPIGYNDKIKEEFDWIFNASDMGLM